jgi:hypothetical protein
LACSINMLHYHIVIVGHEQYEIVKKRLIRAKFGINNNNKYWSKKNNGNFLKAVAYTIKCGEFWTRQGFHVHTVYVGAKCAWVFGEAIVCSKP